MTNHGKWSRPGVPHKGWVCIGVHYLEEQSAICEMCEKQEIRYVHTMSHLDYPDPLECGCVCAAEMEVEYEGCTPDTERAKEREKPLRDRASRRQARARASRVDLDKLAGINLIDIYEMEHKVKERLSKAGADGDSNPIHHQLLLAVQGRISEAEIERKRIEHEAEIDRTLQHCRVLPWWVLTRKGNHCVFNGERRFIAMEGPPGLFRVSSYVGGKGFHNPKEFTSLEAAHRFIESWVVKQLRDRIARWRNQSCSE